MLPLAEIKAMDAVLGNKVSAVCRQMSVVRGAQGEAAVCLHASGLLTLLTLPTHD
ncbi:MAG: hypothetical protein ACT4NL_06210 [Pseudomarimonas sp.]